MISPERLWISFLGSVQTLHEWMDGWEMKASITVDAAESRSITLSAVPPHTLTLAQMRTRRSKQQGTHASDLYVVNNRMVVTFSSAALGFVIGPSEVTASSHHRGDLMQGLGWDQYSLQLGDLCTIKQGSSQRLNLYMSFFLN